VPSSKKSAIKIIACSELNDNELKDLIDMKYREEQEKKQFNNNKIILTENAKLVMFYLNLLQKTVIVFGQWNLNHDPSLGKILILGCRLCNRVLGKFIRMIDNEENTFKLADWENFMTSSVYTEYLSKAKTDIENYKAFLCDVFLLQKKDVLAANEEDRKLDEEFEKETVEFAMKNRLYESVFKFFGDKLRHHENRDNRNLLNVIETLVLLYKLKGEFELNPEAKKRFDIEKYLEKQENTLIDCYIVKTEGELTEIVQCLVD